MTYIEPETVVRHLRPELHTPPRPAFTWGDECPIVGAEYLVEGLLPKRAYSLIYSRFSGGKSFVATDLAYRGATGLSFLGHQIPEAFGSVICVGEKKTRFGKRPRAWLRHHGREGQRLAVLTMEGCPNLTDPAAVSDFIHRLNEEARPMIEGLGLPLECVFLDTLARSLGGNNVSDQAIAMQAVDAIERIIHEAQVAVIPTAHVAKGVGASEATTKGAGEWEDAADAVIRIEREKGESIRTVTNVKQSDGPEAPAAGFMLEAVTLGINDRGQEITSCVVIEVEPPERGTKGRVPVLDPDALKVQAALGRLMDEGQTEQAPLVPGGPDHGRAVLMKTLRQKAYELGLRSGEEPDGGADGKAVSRWQDARKKAFERALAKLEAAHKARREGLYVWPL